MLLKVATFKLLIGLDSYIIRDIRITVSKSSSINDDIDDNATGCTRVNPLLLQTLGAYTAYIIMFSNVCSIGQV